MGNVRTTVRDLLIQYGFYRPGQWNRLVNSSARRQFQHNIQFYRNLLPPNSLVFDVGANIGERSEELLASGSRVVSFEPQRHCLTQLQARCRLHGERLAVVESAVGSESGTATLYMTENGAVSSLARNWVDAPKAAESVSVTTLDTAIQRFGLPYYCKIDVEGWELEVLRGLSQPLPLVSLEFHDRPEDLQKTLHCLRYLSDLSEVEFNVTPAEMLEFRFATWLQVGDFEKVVDQHIRGQHAMRYGDLFVRTPLLQKC